jgi:hypothetical protein
MSRDAGSVVLGVDPLLLVARRRCERVSLTPRIRSVQVTDRAISSLGRAPVMRSTIFGPSGSRPRLILQTGQRCGAIGEPSGGGVAWSLRPWPVYLNRPCSPFTGIAPGCDPEGHSPNQEPEVPDEHVPAERVLVDGPGRGDHIGEDESIGEDRPSAVQDEDQAPDELGNRSNPRPMRAPQGRTRANASSPRHP